MIWGLLVKLPWKEIGSYAPVIVETAVRINKTVQKHFKENAKGINSGNQSVGNNELAARIKKLEENEIEQAALVQNMALQLNKLSAAIQVLSKRVYLSIFLSATGLVILAIVLLWKML